MGFRVQKKKHNFCEQTHKKKITKPIRHAVCLKLSISKDFISPSPITKDPSETIGLRFKNFATLTHYPEVSAHKRHGN